MIFTGEVGGVDEVVKRDLDVECDGLAVDLSGISALQRQKAVNAIFDDFFFFINSISEACPFFSMFVCYSPGHGSRSFKAVNTKELIYEFNSARFNRQ